MLEQLLQNPEHRKILFTGIGNVLKRDDGTGVYITQQLKVQKKQEALTVEVSIENYIGKINSLQPDILILVDCMDLGEKPGHWDLMPAARLTGHTTNTHNISLDQVSELFHSQVYILGIQPADISFGEGLTPRVKKTADTLIEKINRVGEMTATY